MTRTRRPEFVAHRLQLAPRDIDQVDGVLVTSVARTWRDLATVLNLPDLVAAGDSALRGGTTLAELADVAERTKRGRFARRAKEALTLLDARSRSRPESHMRVAVVRAGVRGLKVNESIHWAEGGWLAEPDLALDEAKIFWEYQGADHAKLTRMRKDLTRGVNLREESWLGLYYGPAEVLGRPWLVGAEAAREVGRRAPHLLVPPPSSHRTRARVVI